MSAGACKGGLASEAKIERFRKSLSVFSKRPFHRQTRRWETLRMTGMK